MVTATNTTIVAGYDVPVQNLAQKINHLKTYYEILNIV